MKNETKNESKVDTKSVPEVTSSVQTDGAVSQTDGAVSGVPELLNESTVADEPLFAMDTDELMASGARGGGKRIRPHVGYTLIGKPIVPLPTQARTLIMIIHKNVSKRKPAISEPELLKVLEAARESGELETIQPAWRIFQYYRERLKDAKVLKEVSMTVPAAAVAAAK